MINTSGVPRLSLVGSLVLLFVTHNSSPQTRHLAPPRSTAPRQGGPTDVLSDGCFHKLFSNEHVRVLRVQMTPHQATAVNHRSRDYLIIPLQYADMQTVGEAGSFDFEMRPGQMQVVKGGWPHRTINAADSALDVLEFEISRGIAAEKALCGLGGKECSDGIFGRDESGTYEAATLFETPTVKLRKIELGPGGSLAEHHHAGGEILLAASATDLTHNTAAGSSPLHLDPGQVQWLAPGAEHSLHNESKQPARFYELELK